MKKKGLIAFIAVLGLAVLLLSQFTGMGKDKPTDASGNGKPNVPQNNKKDPGNSRISILVHVSMPPAEFAELQKQTSSYVQSHEGISVQLANLPAAGAYAQLKKSAQLGGGPDLMLLDNAWVNEFAALGFLRPLDESFTVEQQAQRLPSVLKQVKWNGYIWGVPKDIDPYILVWNKKTAAEAKLDHAPGNAEEMLAWSKTFTKPDEGKYGIYFDPENPAAFVALLSSTGLSLADGLHPLQKAGDAALLKNLQAFLVPQEANWNSKTYAKNFPPLQTAGFNAWELLAKGKMAAMLTTLSEYKPRRSGDLALSALPFSVPGGGTWLKGRSFAVSSHTAQPNAAMDWIKEMTSPEAQLKGWTGSGMLPPMPPTAPVYAMAPLVLDESYASITWLVREGRVLPAEMDGAKKMEALHTEQVRLLKGEEDLKVLTEQVAKLWKTSP